MKMALKYRPVEISAKYRIKYRLETGRNETYIWRSRIRWQPAGWQINHKTLGRIHSRLHYLGCHAPEKVQAKWHIVYNQFKVKYLATKGKASNRFLEKHTAYKWL